jgi:hypothetical protein
LTGLHLEITSSDNALEKSLYLCFNMKDDKSEVLLQSIHMKRMTAAARTFYMKH